MEEMLRFSGVTHVYQTKDSELVAIKDLNFALQKGEIVSLVGQSGCGKSTILSMAAGLIRQTEGEVLLHKKKVQGTDKRIAYMLQKDYLFEWKNIFENVLLGLKVRGKVRKTDKQKARALLQMCHLTPYLKMRPSELSGGMRQRAALARTLVLDPEILLLDEPFSALDYQTRLHLVDEVHKIIKEEQKTALFVTHDILEAVSIADRVLVLSERPTTVQKEIDIDLKHLTPFERRTTERFQNYFDIIWKEMEKDGKRIG